MQNFVIKRHILNLMFATRDPIALRCLFQNANLSHEKLHFHSRKINKYVSTNDLGQYINFLDLAKKYIQKPQHISLVLRCRGYDDLVTLHYNKLFGATCYRKEIHFNF